MAEPVDPNPLPASSPDGEGAASLAHVVDDYGPRREALEWAVDELARGREFESVTAELVAGGWSAGDAEDLVEAARRATRVLRGAVTREQALRESNRRYRAGMSGRWFAGFPSIAAITRLIHSLATLASLRRRKK